MKTALVGALLIVGGIASQIIAARHLPGTKFIPTNPATDAVCAPGITSCADGHYAAVGLSTTIYDAVRISGWALIVFGAVIVAFALVREFGRGGRVTQP